MKIGVVGCGVIGSGFAAALSRCHSVVVFDRNPEKVERVTSSCSAQAAKSLSDLVDQSNLLLIAIRPPGLPELANLLAPLLRTGQRIVSVLAGVLMESLQDYFPGCTVVHLMPNLPFRVGKGVLAFESHPSIGAGERAEIERLFSPMGEVVWLPSERMGAIGVVAGSGPAFVAMAIEALVDGAVGIGFPAEEALAIVLQMVEGTVHLLREERSHPAQLRWQVAVAGGTTIEGMRAFDGCGGRSALIEAIRATFDRAESMGH